MTKQRDGKTFRPGPRRAPMVRVCYNDSADGPKGEKVVQGEFGQGDWINHEEAVSCGDGGGEEFRFRGGIVPVPDCQAWGNQLNVVSLGHKHDAESGDGT